MDEQKKKQVDKTIFRISMLPLLLGVAYMFYSALSKKEMAADYYVALGLALGVHWILADVVTVIAAKSFEGKTEDQKKAYRIYALLNLAGFAGLGYFACSVGSNNGIWGVVVYVMTLGQKRKYLDIYKGIAREAEAEEEETEELSEIVEEDAAEVTEAVEADTEEMAEAVEADTAKTTEDGEEA